MSDPRSEEGERLVRSVMEQHRPSFRLACWLGDRATQIEPMTDDGWPRTRRARMLGSCANVAEGWWIRRWVWKRWRAAVPEEPTDE